MCNLIKYKGRSSKPTIDECMLDLIRKLNYMFTQDFITVASCCGHNKYQKTIIIKTSSGTIFELFTGKPIMRTKRFYKKDAEGYYFIPETIEGETNEL
jgi:hypothetical protein